MPSLGVDPQWKSNEKMEPIWMWMCPISRWGKILKRALSFQTDILGGPSYFGSFLRGFECAMIAMVHFGLDALLPFLILFSLLFFWHHMTRFQMNDSHRNTPQRTNKTSCIGFCRMGP